MQAALIAWITIRLWTHFLAYNPDFAQICVENGSERKKGRKRFQLPTCKFMVAGAGFEPTASGL